MDEIRDVLDEDLVLKPVGVLAAVCAVVRVPPEAREAPQPKKRRKKLLPVDVETELPHAYCKKTIQDYQNTLEKRVRPVDWALANKGVMPMTVEQRMKAPTFPGLSEDLQELFRTMMVVGELKLPIAKRRRLQEPTVEEEQEEGVQEEPEPEDVEMPRGERETPKSTTSSRRKGRPSLPFGMEGAMEPPQWEGEDEMPMMEDDVPPMDDQMPPVDDEEPVEEEEEGDIKFEPEEEDESKPVTWHPNTIKILGFLRKHFEAAERRDRRKGAKGPPSLSMHKIAADATRSAAANFFFEILQLKTWDYIQLKQGEPYEDITITKARRFDDPIPEPEEDEEEEPEVQ